MNDDEYRKSIPVFLANQVTIMAGLVGAVAAFMRSGVGICGGVAVGAASAIVLLFGGLTCAISQFAKQHAWIPTLVYSVPVALISIVCFVSERPSRGIAGLVCLT